MYLIEEIHTVYFLDAEDQSTPNCASNMRSYSAYLKKRQYIHTISTETMANTYHF